MIALKPFNLQDLLSVCYRLPVAERELFSAVTGETYNSDDAAATAFAQPGLHWIFADDLLGVSVAAGGFIRQRHGVFRTWMYATAGAWQCAGMTRASRGLIARMLDEKLAHRIETVTLADRSQARDWYGRIGLEYESTLHGYGVGGEDAVMYVAVRKPETA